MICPYDGMIMDFDGLVNVANFVVFCMTRGIVQVFTKNSRK